MRGQLREICNRFHVETMYAFGSRGKEIKACLDKGLVDSDSTADADIGILAHGSLSIREKVDLTTALEDLLQVLRVDLVVLGEADPFLAASIVRGERLYCKDEYSADEFELYVLRRAGDLAPLERERLRLLFGDASR